MSARRVGEIVYMKQNTDIFAHMSVKGKEERGRGLSEYVR